MKKIDSMKETLLIKKMKADDSVELPMDDLFFDQLHDKIMAAVEKTEVKPVNKWQKTWVFLEQKTKNHRYKARRAVKLSIAAVTMSLSISLLSMSLNMFQQAQLVHNDLNQKLILEEAQKNPVEWTEMAINYQNENDYYAEVLSQKDSKTLNEIDQVLAQSL
ncbi:MAG: hypothetical protein ACXVAX_00125 [Pseudobdellovibrio sp.]